MKNINLTIDGTQVTAREGMTLLEAATEAGIKIPTLCWEKKIVEALGTCRICSVEVTERKKTRIVTSCNYPVVEGLTVNTKSERVMKGRKILMELIMVRWPWISKEWLKEYGIEKTRFKEEISFCSLCGLCVQYCCEVKKAHALGYLGRGAERMVVLYPEIAIQTCPTCKECFNICPTGIIPNDFTMPGPLFGKKLPRVFPVRVRDDQKLQELLHKVGAPQS